MWIFGYGSLIWKVGFEFEERREGYVDGWARRFWQESTDHRGVPEAPGRVVTLVPEADARTWGVAYRVSAATYEAVLDKLDYREKGGYERHHVTIYDRGGELVTEEAVIYIGGRDNPNWGGPLPEHEIAKIVQTAVGPSGPNVEYVLNLHRALGAMGVVDKHLEAIVAALP